MSRLANGVYATVPIGADPETFAPDIYLSAAAIRPDAVFAYHSALELLGQAHSVWWTCTVCTDRPRSPVEIGRSTIKFLSHPPVVSQGTGPTSPRERAGAKWTTAVHRGGRVLRVTMRERTLVDGFRELGLVGGVDELIGSMDGFATLEPDVLTDVLRAYGSRRLWAAVGWYLERRLESLFLSDSILGEFKANRPRARVYLVPGQRGGVVAPDWNLIVPAHLQRSGRGAEHGS